MKIQNIGEIKLNINLQESYCYIEYYDKLGQFIKRSDYSIWEIVKMLKEYGKVYGRMKKYYENSN